MIIKINKNEYKELIGNSVFQYSSSMKNAIIRSLGTSGKITFKDDDVREGSKYPILCKDIEDAIGMTTLEDELIPFYEKWEFEKSYNYSIPLVYKLSDNKEFESIVSELASNGKLFYFNETEDFVIPYEVTDDIKESVPYYKKDGDYALFKFVIKQIRYDKVSETNVYIKYPIVISVNLKKSFLEIRFDSGRFDEKSQRDYITPKVNHCIKWLKEILKLDLYNVNSENAIDIIKNDKSKKAVVHKQMMELSSGGSAELTASADKDYMLPFIGDFRNLINQNSELFDKSPEIRQLIEEFLINQEETAEYPYISVRWLNNIKGKQLNVKIVFNYYNGKYIQMHNLQSSMRVTKERMEYAIEYLFENGSFTEGERI